MSNAVEFCNGVDVILAQTDTESSKIILHRIAKRLRLPVICGSRGSIFGHRWNIKAKIWNYKKYHDMPCYDETNHPEIALIPFEELTEELLKEFDSKIKIKKMQLFAEYAKSNPELFGSIEKKILMKELMPLIIISTGMYARF